MFKDAEKRSKNALSWVQEGKGNPILKTWSLTYCLPLPSPSVCFTPDEPCDVTSKSSTLKLFTFAKTVFDGNPPDIVVANAGVSEVGHLDDDVVLGEF
jgi:hypothetical protein